jgi:peptide/nickel transport system substrate-binding protein
MVNGDFAPTPGALRRALATRPDQVTIAPASGNRYVALNTRVAPFRNVNVRRAVVAAFDRARVQSIRGGPATARVASHFIPPGMPGFEEAGGEAGPRYPFLSRPRGSLRVARRYLRRARFSPRRATRRHPVLMVGVRTGVARTLAVHTRRQLRKLGFRVRLRLVSQDAMYLTWCGVPRRRVAVCPNVGWLEDFNDAQTMLDPTFNGRSITSRFNGNWPLLDDRRVNRAIEAAKRVVDPAARARAWGLVDRRITSLAAAVPLVWDMQPNVRSANVESLVNGASFGWDLSFTRLR